MSRLRWGERGAGLGAALLLGSLFLDWVGPPGRSGWSSLGWLTVLVCVADIAVAAWLVAATALARPLAQMVAACALTATVGTLAFVVVLVRIAIVQPGPNAVTTIEAGAYVGLAAALLIAVAGWWAIKDERTDAPESAYTPPAPRPAPPARSA